MAGKAMETVEGAVNRVKDSFDPMSGLKRNVVDARDWLVKNGMSVKEAKDTIISVVSRAVRENKKPSSADTADGEGGQKNE